MDPNTPIAIEDSTVAEPHSCPGDVSVDATAQYRSDLVTFGWWLIAVGSILAAGIYPFVSAAVGVTIHLLSGLVYGFSTSRFDASDWIRILLFIPVFCIGCILWVGAIAAVALPVLHLVVRSLELRVSFTRLGAFTGGLLIFVATLPMSLGWPQMQFNSGWQEVIRVMLMGPALATIVGQVGGAYGGLRAVRRAEYQSKVRQRLMKLGWREPAVYHISRDANEPSTNKNRLWFRFRTTHLLWVVVWISLLLAAIRLVGLRFETVLPVIFGWLLYQTVILWLGAVLVRRIAPWWACRWQGRST